MLQEYMNQSWHKWNTSIFKIKLKIWGDRVVICIFILCIVYMLRYLSQGQQSYV